MSINRTVIKVFLASPGDLTEERRTAKRVVEEENANHANVLGYQFELVGWEDTVAQHGRAQEVINRDLDQCNFFIGVVWKRWGTPPGPAGSPYSSGFEEEYHRSEERFSKTGKPQISMLFKNISDEDKRDAGPQLNKVLNFKKQFIEDYRGAYQSFTDTRDFEQRFRAIIAMFLRNQQKEDGENNPDEKSRLSDGPNKQNSDMPLTNDTFIEKSALSFVNDLLNRKINSKESEYSATEAARFRLIANSLETTQNDNEPIGVHDANLIYRDLKNEAISEREVRALIKCGLRYFSSRNAPLWHWLYRGGANPRRELAMRTIMGTTQNRGNAFLTLALLSETLAGLDSPIDRETLVGWWFRSEDKEVLVPALTYLSECGLDEDLKKIEGLLSSSEATVSKAAVSATIKILARDSISKSLEFVASRDDCEVSKELAKYLFASPAIIGTALLKRCIGNRSIEFKKRVATELLKRDSIDSEEAKLLTESNDAETRAIGARAFGRILQDFSVSDAKRLIVKPKPNGTFNLLSTRDAEGEQSLEAYKHEILCTKTINDLEILQKDENPYDYDISLAIYDTYFKKEHQKIVENIEDDFRSFFSTKFEKLATSNSPPSENIHSYLSKKMLNESIGLISRKGKYSDLNLVRRKIDSSSIEYTASILRFLARHGSWEDVDRLIKLCKNFPHRGQSLLSSYDNREDVEDTANVILRLGRERIGDVFEKEMPSFLMGAIFKAIPKTLFISFDDRLIEDWLRHPAESVRQIVALKAIMSLPRTRLKKILAAYTNGTETYYYHAVFWLDLGIAAETSIARSVAEKAIAAN